MISPQEIGLPPKFASWRKGQDRVITNMLYPTRRYGVHVVPMGGGKTACYMAVALISKKRTLILTSTKGLQDQLSQEFGDKIAVVKGQSAYKCKLSDNRYFCNTGSCHWGFECPYKNNGCNYREAVRHGAQSHVVVTNYSFWMANDPDVLGEFDLLVMDEAHDAAEHLVGALSMGMRREETAALIDWVPPGSSTHTCNEWAKILRGRVDDAVKRKKGKGNPRGHYHILALQQKLQLLGMIWPDNWVVEHKGNSVSWDVIWPAPLAQAYLFRGISHVIMTSATVTKADMEMLGVEPKDYTFTEYPSTFPVANRPIYFIPTVRMDRFITNAGMNAWATRIDNIIAGRFSYKGIIHTVSYERANRICNFSTYKDFMMSHTGKTTAETIARFKEAEPPCVLVSPSMVTGYDFPDDEARYQIIGKVPFPDSRPLVMKARQKVNPDYGCYIAIKQMIQASGRITRSPTDWGQSFVIDSHFAWVVSKYKDVLPKWWKESIITTNVIPKSPEGVNV